MRLLTRTDLVNTLGDVFPEVRTQWSGSLPASTISAYGFDNEASASVGSQLASAILDTGLAVAAAVTGTSFYYSTLLEWRSRPQLRGHVHRQVRQAAVPPEPDHG